MNNPQTVRTKAGTEVKPDIPARLREVSSVMSDLLWQITEIKMFADLYATRVTALSEILNALNNDFYLEKQKERCNDEQPTNRSN